MTSEGTTQAEIPSPVEIRDELVTAVVGDLLGPANGPEEEFFGVRPTDRYLVGRLAPRAMLDPAEFDDLGGAGDPTDEDGKAEAATPPARSLAASSIGLTFEVAGNVNEIEVSATWGQYLRTQSESAVTEAGRPRTVWRRTPAGGPVSLPLRAGRVEGIPDAERPEVTLEGRIRRGDDDSWIVTLFLVNGHDEPDTNRDEVWLFQPTIGVFAADGAAIFVQRAQAGTGAGAGNGLFATAEQAAMDMIYRRFAEFAVGHGVSVHAEPDVADPSRATRIRTAVVPSFDVPMTEAATAADHPEIADLVLDMRALSELEGPALADTLQVLHAGYKAKIQRWGARVATERDLESHQAAAADAREHWQRALDRLAEGIDIIRTNPLAADAFRIANRAMYLQRVRSEFAAKQRRGDGAKLEDLDIPENRSWRPFQLAFVLLALAGATDPTHDDRSDPTAAVVDLLWFPTGGGKTEAYLGLAAYVMALRRLQPDLGGLDGRGGVAVIMRYTLRLLTIQQFQRATALLCAMEAIRRAELDAGETRLGAEPFRIGLWVGRRATPNTTEQADRSLQDAKGDTWHGGFGTGTPAQLTSCPWCGAPINPGRDIVVDRDLERTITYCSDLRGECLFSRGKAAGEGLPVVVVDSEIYQRLPALIIATVDKFAQMPWRGEVQSLFGRISGRCARHGYLSADANCSGNHPKRRAHPAVKRIDAGRLRPPDLIIQDELHLISGPLGSLVGLYETAIDDLCQWDLDGTRVRPKVVASTATIRNAQRQVHSLFLRKAEIFPPNGLDVDDNFFAKQRPPSAATPGRRYIGLSASGRDRPSVLIRVYTAFLTAAQALAEKYQRGTDGADRSNPADPWMTLVGYFNSLRELGGMRRLIEDDVRTRAFRVDRSDLERPGLAKRNIRVVEELTSRKSATDIPQILDHLETPFRSLADPHGPVPIDVILATNMISVGVDIRRLGLMVVSGQPKTVAEYIQATSRVGREWPGIVCTVFNWARPRDLSHYESFEHFHATYYKQVEALSLTPFSPRAIDRGLTGVLTAMLRLGTERYAPNDGASRLDTGDPALQRVRDAIVARGWAVTDRKETKDALEALIAGRVDDWAHEASIPDRTLCYRTLKDGKTIGLLHHPGAGRWGPFTVLNSLREVEPTVRLLLQQDAGGALPDWTAPADDGAAS